MRFGCVWFRLGHPNVRTDLKFPKDCMFISFEVVGENEVDLCGYVTGLDTNKMMSLKEAMEMSDGSDDDEYKEEEEEEGEKEEQQQEEHNEASNTSRNAVPFDQPVTIARPAHA